MAINNIVYLQILKGSLGKVMSKPQHKAAVPVGYLTKQRGQHRTKDRRHDDEYGNRGPRVRRGEHLRAISADDAYEEYLIHDNDFLLDDFPDDKE